MGFKQTLSKGLRNFGGVKISHGAVLTYTALILVLFIAFTVRVLPMRWEIPQGTLGLNEFDPYYQYTATNHMVQDGLLSLYLPHPWIDTQQFFPSGIDFSGVLPSLPTTAAALYDVVHGLGVSIDLMSFCSILAPILGTLAVFVLYFIGKDYGGKSVGLLAALILALSPSVIQRSSLGFFDTETVGVLGLLLFIYAFLRAIDPKRSLRSMTVYSMAAAGALAYFAAGWGAAYYLIGLAALFVFVLILMKRYSQRLLISYSITFGLGFFISIIVPFLSVHYITSGVVLPVAGVFALLCLAEVYRAKVSAKGKTIFAILLLAIVVGGFAALVAKGDLSNVAEKFGTVLNPLQRSALPIIASVAEQRITAWAEIYSEVGIGILFFLMGLYFMVRNPTNRNVFLVIFGLTALYFAGSMVRLLVVLAPASGLLGAMAVSGILKPFNTLFKESSGQALTKSKRSLKRVGKEFGVIGVLIVFALLVSTIAYTPWLSNSQDVPSGAPRVYGSVYSPITISVASLPIAPNQPVPQWRNMLSWTRNNLQSTTVVSSWWDYGDWLGMFGNVTTLCDNTTTNTTQIENVAYSMMANETQSLKMLANYNTSYVLVFVTLQLKLSSDQTQITGVQFGGYGDEGKWPWMARISGEAETRLMGDTTFGQTWMTSNYSWTNDTTFATSVLDNSTGQQSVVWTDMGLNSTVYKLMYDAESRYAAQYPPLTVSETAATKPTYFTPAYIAGLELTPTESAQYGLLVPLVALYKIDWAAYDAATNSTVSISP